MNVILDMMIVYILITFLLESVLKLLGDCMKWSLVRLSSLTGDHFIEKLGQTLVQWATWFLWRLNHVYFFMWECVLELLDPMEFLGNLNCWCYFVCPIFFENEKGFWLEEYSKIFLLFSRYNHLMFADYREPLVEVAAQLLVVLLDHDSMQPTPTTMNGTDTEHSFEVNYIYFKTVPCIFLYNPHVHL